MDNGRSFRHGICVETNATTEPRDESVLALIEIRKFQSLQEVGWMRNRPLLGVRPGPPVCGEGVWNRREPTPVNPAERKVDVPVPSRPTRTSGGDARRAPLLALLDSVVACVCTSMLQVQQSETRRRV